MKQLIFLVSLVLFCACQKTEDLLDNGSDGQSTAVTVDLTLPDGLQSRAATRAYGDGMTVQHIRWAVYKSSTPEGSTPGNLFKSGIYEMKTEDVGKMDSRFIIEGLTTGEIYDFVFWAENKNSGYTFNEQEATVSMNYTSGGNGWKGATCNDETRDAFFCSKRNVTIAKGQEVTAVLYRPFAQLNILTDDLPENDQSTYWVQMGSGTFYDKLNLLDGTATNSGLTPTFLAAKASSEKMTINNETYTVISMNYLLMPGKLSDSDPSYKDATDTYKRLYSVELFAGRDGDKTRPLLGTQTSATDDFIGLRNVPFKRNYRTNIYGSLLTSNVSVRYTIQPGFNDDDLTGITVTNADELKKIVTDAKNETLITLMSNIELNAQWEIKGSTNEKNITIDLNGYDIKGVAGSDSEGRWGDNSSLIKLNDSNVTLTIEDSEAGNGNVGLGLAEYAVLVQNGNLIINGGDFKGYKGCVKWLNDDQRDKDKSPIVYIYGGVFSAVDTENGAYRMLDIDSRWGENNHVTNFIVYGGRFGNYNPSKALTSGFSPTVWNFLPRNEDELQAVGDQGNTYTTDYTITFDAETKCYTVSKK